MKTNLQHVWPDEATLGRDVPPFAEQCGAEAQRAGLAHDGNMPLVRRSWAGVIST